MGRAKIKRGNTNIDMTAMCDVAFLLLSFFILTTKFKPAEAVEVSPPSSVASKIAPQTDAFMVSINKEGKIFIQMSDDMKGDVINELSTSRNLNLTAEDKKYFTQSLYVGTPLNQLTQFIRVKPEDLHKYTAAGVPADTSNNELQAWINAAVNAYKGKKINFLIKGDNNSKYSAFRDVINAFKKNEVFKYQLVTNAEDVPAGSELEKKAFAGEQATE
ncbi:MAG TPA: biopolymer transporter ExbD [Chitinophagaceae bacterium]|nr:biopolymer transporter ExbD [Chitinophagaceae bacterium]